MVYDIEDYIKVLLDKACETDTDLVELRKKTNKSLKECAEYIKEWCLEGRKKTNGMGVGGSDEDLLGKCIHYYQEDDCKPKGTATNAVATTSKPKATTAKPTTDEDVDFSSCDWDDEEEEEKPQPKVKLDLKVVKKPTKNNNDDSDDIFSGCDW